MPGDVLEGLLILLMDLGALPQCKLAIGGASEMSALFILLTADANLAGNSCMSTTQRSHKTHLGIPTSMSMDAPELARCPRRRMLTEAPKLSQLATNMYLKA